MGFLHSSGPQGDAPVTCTYDRYKYKYIHRNAVANRSATSVRKVRWARAGNVPALTHLGSLKKAKRLSDLGTDAICLQIPC